VEDVPGVVELHRVKWPHVEDDPIALDRMPTHAVTGAGDRDGEAFSTGTLNEGDELPLGRDRVSGNVPDRGDTSLV
jgi:hypothetical protein